ncbi:MAG TPA: inorganic phosphate transporter [Acidimicrobiales bacterium]|nr:inorganic phosphate transporter [Acidimicrobiales bacterium]
MVFALIALSIGFGLANGVHDAGNAIAAPIVTRALRATPALVLAAVAHVLGAVVAGTAVAATVASIVSVPAQDLTAVLGAALVGALVWSLVTLWRGLPCSSGHCVVGALAGAALADGGARAVDWGGLQGFRPTGVVGSLVWLVFSTGVSLPLALLGIRAARRWLRRAPRSVVTPIRRSQVVTTALLSFAHGSNDAQKTMGLLVLSLVAGGRLASFSVPLWVVLTAAAALTLGTTLGGWRVVRTLGRGIYPLRSLEGLVSQGAASAIVLVASLVGAPVSTTDVVAPAVVGVGAGQRWHHVRWVVVGEIGLAWLVTLPVSAALAALALPVWKAIA